MFIKDEPETIEEFKNEECDLESYFQLSKQNPLKKKSTSIKDYFQCDICTKKFTNEDSLLDHKDNFNHEELKCTFCGKFFPQNYFLERNLICFMTLSY